MEMHAYAQDAMRIAPRFFAPARLSVRICTLRNDQGSQADNERIERERERERERELPYYIVM